MTMGLRCVYRIKIRSREALQVDKSQAPSWLHAGLMPPSCPWIRENRYPWVENRKHGGQTRRWSLHGYDDACKMCISYQNSKLGRCYRPQSFKRHHGWTLGYCHHQGFVLGKSDIRRLETECKAAKRGLLSLSKYYDVSSM